MKKVAALVTTGTYFLSYAMVLAQNNAVRNTNVVFPGQGIDPTRVSLGQLVSNVLRIIFIAAGLAVLIYMVIGAFQWITSGGDKDKVAAARKSIVNALIGLALLALSYFITVVVGQVLNIDVLNFGTLPSLNDNQIPPR